MINRAYNFDSSALSADSVHYARLSTLKLVLPQMFNVTFGFK